MKNAPLFSIILIMASAFINTSCQKEVDTVPPERIDSIKSVLPKQIIWTWNENVAVDGETYVYNLSMKYDKANYRIELYEDDTTNSNPYDRLAITYNYNKDGYLVSFETNFRDGFWPAIFDKGTAKINRDVDNKIIYIAYEDKYFDTKDTSFYTYQPVNGGINITSDGSYSYFAEPTVYNYNNNYNLLAYHVDYVNVTFSYNPNNSINKMISDGYGNNVADFSYTSGLPDEKEDMFYKLLLGKDYYLWDLKQLYPFTIFLNPDFEDYLISVTNPYHLTSMKDTYHTDDKTTVTDKANLKYELNSDKLLSKITFKVDAPGWESEGSMRLKY